MLSKLFLVFLMSFVFVISANAKASEGRRDGPFPMFTAGGVWQDPDQDLKVEITNGKLSRDRHFMPVTVTVYAADGSAFAQGSGLHYMLDSDLSVQLLDIADRKMNLRMTAYYGPDEHPFPDGEYQLVMSIGYVYEKEKEKGKSVEFLIR